MNIGHIAKILFILLLILILIAVNIGVIRWSIWFQILKIWPIILTAFVLEFGFQYFNNSIFRIIPVVLAASSILAIVYLSGTPDFFSIKKIERQEIGQLLGDNTVKNVDVNISLNSGKLIINGGAEDLYEGSISYRNNVVPLVQTGQSGSEYGITLTDNDHSQYLFGPGDGEHTWSLKLNNSPFVNVETKTLYNDNNFDFTDVKLLNAKFSSQYDTSNIKIGDKSDRVRINAVVNFSRMNFLLPSKFGVRIKMDTKAVFSNAVSLGFNEIGNVLSSPNYLIADKKIDIDMSGLGSSVNFQLY